VCFACKISALVDKRKDTAVPFPYLDLTGNRYIIHWFVDGIACKISALVGKRKDTAVPFPYLDLT
jgi:hypothetical protein